ARARTRARGARTRARRRGSSRRSRARLRALFALPVVNRVGEPEPGGDLTGAAGAARRPRHRRDLARVRVDPDLGGVHLAQDQVARGPPAAVGDRVGAVGPAGEGHHVAGAELAPAARPAHARGAREDDQELLVAAVVVVGPGPCARLELVEAEPELAGARLPPQASAADAGGEALEGGLGDARAHRPRNSGSRFSTNARMPSTRS